MGSLGRFVSDTVRKTAVRSCHPELLTSYGWRLMSRVHNISNHVQMTRAIRISISKSKSIRCSLKTRQIWRVYVAIIVNPIHAQQMLEKKKGILFFWDFSPLDVKHKQQIKRGVSDRTLASSGHSHAVLETTSTQSSNNLKSDIKRGWQQKPFRRTKNCM